MVVRALLLALELAEAQDRRRCLRCWTVMVMAMAVVRMRKAEVLGR